MDHGSGILYLKGGDLEKSGLNTHNDLNYSHKTLEMI